MNSEEESEAEAFLASLDPELLGRYEVDPGVIYILDPAWRIVWCNAAWDKFAKENGAPELVRSSAIGTRVMNVVCGDLQDFYRGLFRRALGEGKIVGHFYQCSSADVLRLFHLRVIPLLGGGLVLIHAFLGGMQHEQAREGRYEEGGLVHMCAHCRRSKRPGTALWDWVPELVRTLPENVSMELCAFCRGYHYPASIVVHPE